MGDRIGVQLLIREIYLGLPNHPGQLSLAISLWLGTMSTEQKAVMLCGWGIKGRYCSCLVAGKTMLTLV